MRSKMYKVIVMGGFALVPAAAMAGCGAAVEGQGADKDVPDTFPREGTDTSVLDTFPREGPMMLETSVLDTFPREGTDTSVLDTFPREGPIMLETGVSDGDASDAGSDG